MVFFLLCHCAEQNIYRISRSPQLILKMLCCVGMRCVIIYRRRRRALRMHAYVHVNGCDVNNFVCTPNYHSYLYQYTHTHTYKDTRTDKNTHTHTHTFLYVKTNMQIWEYVRRRAHACMLQWMNIYECASTL